MAKYTLGIDYGTDSVRTVIADVSNGNIVGTAVSEYKRWKAGKYCNPAKNQFRQHPLDYIESLEESVKGALSNAPVGTASNVIALTIDTTGSTPVAVDKNGTPLSLLPEYAENPNAMFVLWKDHTAVKEADEINQLSKKWQIDYTKFEGGIYSSEWFWAKVLHVIREDTEVYKNAWSWVEHCDWLPAMLTGTTKPETLLRSRCAAGHKAMWADEFGGLPTEDYLKQLDPKLKGLRERLFSKTYNADVKIGNITVEWAKKLGLTTNVAVGVGAFDAHLGAVGAEIKPYYLCKVMGTSTCDMLIAPEKEVNGKLVSGICGQVNGSIVPGMIGLEAGQSAFGDIYAWFKNLLINPVINLLNASQLIDAVTKEKLISELETKLIPYLSEEASKVNPSESNVLALDWMNGRRTPDANQLLKGVIAGISLGSDAGKIFRALVESTAFGAKKIVDRFISEGIRIDGIIALGGVAKKSPFIMQTMCDVLNMPIQVVVSEQACALGSAMAAAVVGGAYATFEEAQKAMGSGFEKVYQPNPKMVKIYNELYSKYCRLAYALEPMYNEGKI